MRGSCEAQWDIIGETMKNHILRSPATMSFLIMFFILPIAALEKPEHLHAGTSAIVASESEPTLQSPVKTQYIFVQRISREILDNFGMFKLIVTVKNTGNQRAEYMSIDVRYINNAGKPLDRRTHFVRASVDPGQTMQLSLPEYSPAGEDGNPRVTAQAIIRPRDTEECSPPPTPTPKTKELTPQKHDLLLLKGKSFTSLNDQMRELTIVLENTGNQIVEDFGVRVRYKNNCGDPLGGIDHYIQASIAPGKTVRMSLPEHSPPGAIGGPSIDVKANLQ